jgi:hypothetical protein
MNNGKVNLLSEYRLVRKDGSPVDPEGQYFVVKFNSRNPAHRQASLLAGLAYAAAIRDADPALAKSIYLNLNVYEIPVKVESMIVAAAQTCYGDEFDVDNDARVSVVHKDTDTGFTGAWIQGWGWFPIEDWPEELQEKYR